MYNGIEAAKVKGSGLSGYVQRSKATIVSQAPKHQAIYNDMEAEEGAPALAINPLVEKRSRKENEDLARRLESHKAIRGVHLKVLRYRAERLAGGAGAAEDAEVVERECRELYRSLMAAAMEVQRQNTREAEAKSAERFAAAFGVKTGGDPFNRTRQEDERQAREAERQKAREQQLVERLKRVKGEEATV